MIQSDYKFLADKFVRRKSKSLLYWNDEILTGSSYQDIREYNHILWQYWHDKNGQVSVLLMSNTKLYIK